MKLDMFGLFKHKHKWQTRARNGYSATTYRVCLKCGKSEHLKKFKFEPCDRIKEFDEQFDKNNNFIF